MSLENWAPKKLNELGFIGRGKSKHRPRNAPFLYGGNYPFVQTGDIKSAELYVRNYSQTYSEQGLAQSKLWRPDTLCITIAANIAETAILGIEACFPDSIVGFVADPEKADVRFVKYYIDTIKLHMQNISRGTTQDNLSLEKLLTFDILTPPLPIQRKIAAVLSAYDDLIEVNTRRIRLLEEMAQAVYREWFGSLDAASLPEGWEVGPLEDALVLQRGFDLPKRDRKEGNVPIFASTGIAGFHNEVKVKAPGVVTGRSGSLGTVIYVEDDYWPLNTTLWVREFRRVTPIYAYYLLKEMDFSQFNSGAAVPTLNRNDVHGLPVIIPSQDILAKFDEFVLPLYDFRRNLTEKNANLRRTRDLLLPRLVSGEVEV